MDLEYAFFAAQSQGTAEDDRPTQLVHGSTASRDGASGTSGVRYAGERGRLSGVHGNIALLCVDFDDTLTDGDTTSLLVKTAQAQVRVGRATRKCILCNARDTLLHSIVVHTLPCAQARLTVAAVPWFRVQNLPYTCFLCCCATMCGRTRFRENRQQARRKSSANGLV